MITHDHITAAALSFWSYHDKNDKDNVINKINAVWGGALRPHFIKSPDGSHFYGLVTDDATQTAWLVNRGTAGDKPFGNLHSWLYDINVFTGRDGMHNGFQWLANTVFDRFKNNLPNYKRIKFVGQSQGCGAAQIEAKLAFENLSRDKDFEIIIFAAPPAGDKTFAATMAPYFASKRLRCTRYIMPGDPIASSVLRDQESWLLDGVDIGDPVILPDLVQYNIGPADLVMHSCRMYTAGMMMQLALEGGKNSADYEFLGKVFKWCKN